MERLFEALGILFVTLFTALFSSIALLIMLPVTAIDGWILHLAWGWFVVPTFGVPQIAWAMATGIVLLVSWITYQLPPKLETEGGSMKRMAISLVVSLMSWLMMWGVHMWIVH